MEFVYLLILHIFGDFIFQSDKTAVKKNESRKYFIIHSLLYALPFLTIIIVSDSFLISIIEFLFIAFSHAIVDLIRIKISEKFEKINKVVSFIIDQFIHIIIIYSMSEMIYFKEVFIKYVEYKNLYIIMVYILVYLVCTTPAAVFIKNIFLQMEFQKDSDELVKSGYYIGILERVIILTLGLMGEIGAIGFVIAAKSIARFKQLEDKRFAEKYLFGTLLSTLISLACVGYVKLFL